MKAIKTKVVGYIRVSTLVQVKEGQGLKVQREQIARYCKESELELVKIYEDPGISGAKAKDEGTLNIESIDREGFQDMITEIPSLGVKYVVVANTSRLWRSDIVKVVIQRDFRKHNIDVKSVEQPTYSIYSQDDPNQFLFNAIMEALDQYEKLATVIRLGRARRSKARRGGFAIGPRALGYKKTLIENKPDITIDLDEARTISLIKKLRRSGLSMQKIANHLNDEGVKTKRRGKWFASTIKYILSNKLYKGRFEQYSHENKRPELAIR